MASNTSNKNRPATKTGTTKAPNYTTRKRQQAALQRMAVVLFTVGAFFFLLALVKGSAGWFAARSVLLGLFGPTAYLIGPLLMYVAAMASFDKLAEDLSLRAGLTLVFGLAVSGAFQIFLAGPVEAEGVLPVLQALYIQGVALEGGGVASAVFGLPLMLLGSPGDAIVVSLLLFLLLMIISKSTLAGFMRAVGRPVERMADASSALAASIPSPYHTSGRNGAIDIPMNGKPNGKSPKPQTTIQPSAAGQRLLDVLKSEKPREVPGETADGHIGGTAQVLAADAPIHGLQTGETARQPDIDDIIRKINRPSQTSAGHGAVPAHEELPGQVALSDGDKTTEQSVQELVKPPEPPAYELPPLTLLRQPKRDNLSDDSAEMRRNAERLINALRSFGVETRIVGINRGPTVTCYEIQLAAGVKISKITGLADDIALNLAVPSVRIAPVPNKMAVGIEVPNRSVASVGLREILESPLFTDAQSRVTVALGRGITGEIKTADISKMPHILIAGATGSGKSVCINSIIMSLLYKAKPDELKMLMVDPKVVELGIYNGLPHLVSPVVNDPKKAAGVLGWAVSEMNQRYELIAAAGARDINAYNKQAKASGGESLPRIVIIIDELADLMMVAPAEVEDYICRLAQKARAAGIHLVVATQRPSVDVITGVIKANIPSRVAFAVASQVDSRTILDMGGAEKLLGAGDMLFFPAGTTKPVRLQGCFVSDDEIERVTSYIKSAWTNLYDQKVIEEIDRHTPTGKGGVAAASHNTDGSEEDTMLTDAIECVIDAGMASTSLLQRKCKLGYARAARIIDELEARGIVGPFEGSKPRQVLISRARWQEMKMNIRDKSTTN